MRHVITRELLPILALPVVFLLASCGREDASSATNRVVADSSGIRIVTYSGTPASAASLGLEAVHEHGAREGQYEFTRLWVGALRRDGSAVVYDSGSGELVEVSRDGSGYSVLASRGSGPAEVQRVMSVHAAGADSLWVEDDGNGKIVLVRGGGIQTSVSTKEDYSLNLGLRILGLDGSDRFLMSTSSFRSDFDVPWLSGQIVAFHPTTGAVDTVGEYPLASKAPDGPIHPFGYYGEISGTGTGVVHGRTDRPELVWRASDGSIQQILRWNPEPRYPTPEDWERLKTALRVDLRRVNPQYSGEQLEEFLNRAIERYEVDFERPFPLFLTLHGDDEGGVWLAEYWRGPENRVARYDVVSSDGTWLGSIEFPSPVRVLDIRGDHILTDSADEMDIPRVAVYRMVRNPA